jgi:hypothetical protein
MRASSVVKRQSTLASLPLRVSTHAATSRPNSSSLAKALFDEALADALDGCAPDIQCFADLLIRPSDTAFAAVRFEQDAGASERARRCPTRTHHLL